MSFKRILTHEQGLLFPVGRRLTSIPAICLFGLTGVMLVNQVHADLTGFGGNGTGYQLNNSNGDPATINNNVLTVTDGLPDANGHAGQGNSLFATTPQPYQNGFTASFTYQASNFGGIGAADGFAFVLQNDPRGLYAVGAPGGTLGYASGYAPQANVNVQGLTNTVGVEYSIYGGSGSNLVGASNPNSVTTGTYSPTGSVNLASGDPINVTVTYNPFSSTNFTETLQDTVTNATYSAGTNVNMQAILGNSGTALVGFSGGDGQGTSLQQISNFSYEATQPSPSVLDLSTGLNPVNSGVSFNIFLGNPAQGGELLGSIGSQNLAGDVNAIIQLDGNGNGVVQIIDSNVKLQDLIGQVVNLGGLGTIEADLKGLSLDIEMNVPVSHYQFSLDNATQFSTSIVQGTATLYNPTGQLANILPNGFSISNNYGIGPAYISLSDVVGLGIQGTVDNGQGPFSPLAEINLPLNGISTEIPINSLPFYIQFQGSLNVAVPETSSVLLAALGLVAFAVPCMRRMRAAK